MRNHLASVVRRVWGVFALALSAASPAAIITVGTPAGAGQCTCDNLTCAFDLANGNGFASNEVRLMYYAGVNGFAFYKISQALTVDSNKELIVTGGYGVCDQAVSDGTRTNVDGHKGYDLSLGPVFSIDVATGSVARLRLLNIGAGNNHGNGGGIYFSGGGTLDIADSLIDNNDAWYGAGIYAFGTGTTKLVIGPDVVIDENIASGDGGGIAVVGAEMFMDSSNSSIGFFGNQASGRGGGVYVGGHDGIAGKAHIGSAGNAVFNNSAMDGGGIAVVATDGADDDNAYLYLQSVSAADTTGIIGNFASSRGGGVYVKGDCTSFPTHFNDAVLTTGNYARIDSNAAPSGAAVYLDHGEDAFGENCGAEMSMTSGSISGNLSMDAGSNFTDGAIIHEGDFLQFWNVLQLSRVVMRGNHGGPALRNDGHAVLKNMLIADNISSSSVISGIGSDGSTQIVDSTIAHNQVGGTYVISQSNDTTLQRLIIDQPGKAMLQHGGGTVTVQQLLSSDEVASLNAGSEAYSAAPRFVDPAHGDYELQAASPAVDFAPVDGTQAVDFFGAARDVDLSFKANLHGPRDLGAFERQSIQPLVLNADFDWSDLRLWTGFAGVWDGTSNATGASGSGSWKYSAPNTNGTHVVVAQQCVFLPGPASYVISGWGHTSGLTVDTRDYARLAWEFRYDGGEACTGGTPTASGEFTLGHSTGWTGTTNPVPVDVFEWSHNSSITLYLVASAGTITTARSINAWFDGITIQPQALVDLIFADGFE